MLKYKFTILIQVCAYNRTVEKVDKFLANEAKGTKIIGAKSLKVYYHLKFLTKDIFIIRILKGYGE